MTKLLDWSIRLVASLKTVVSFSEASSRKKIVRATQSILEIKRYEKIHYDYNDQNYYQYYCGVVKVFWKCPESTDTHTEVYKVLYREPQVKSLTVIVSSKLTPKTSINKTTMLPWCLQLSVYVFAWEYIQAFRRLKNLQVLFQANKTPDVACV